MFPNLDIVKWIIYEKLILLKMVLTMGKTTLQGCVGEDKGRNNTTYATRPKQRGKCGN